VTKDEQISELEARVEKLEKWAEMSIDWFNALAQQDALLAAMLPLPERKEMIEQYVKLFSRAEANARKLQEFSNDNANK